MIKACHEWWVCTWHHYFLLSENKCSKLLKWYTISLSKIEKKNITQTRCIDIVGLKKITEVLWDTKPVWAYNKPSFLKLIKSLYVSLQSQFTCFCKSNIDQILPTVKVWYEVWWGLQFSQKSDIWYKNWSPFCLYLYLKICAIWRGLHG